MFSVDAELREYKMNVALYDSFKLELKIIENETVEKLALPSVILSDIPKSVTHKIHNPVADICEALSNDTDVQFILRETNKLANKIERVNIALKCLSRKQRYLIECRYFENMSWEETRMAYCKEFPRITEVNFKIEYNYRPYLELKSIQHQTYHAKNKIKKILKCERSYSNETQRKIRPNN